MKVDNAIIMAAGTASRFAPLSYEKPKALIEVRGEVLIERQIRQLREAGIEEVVVVTGYKAEQFEYLKDKYGVVLINNPYYLTRNNNSSIYAAREYIKNSYICSSDNYFITNPFESDVDESYYSAVYMEGDTGEWCISEDDGWIKDVKVGGQDSWVMLGHVFWSESFSRSFLHILEDEYEWPETADKLWETIYIEHINELPMKIRKYPADFIFEFDTLDELREFDDSYISNTRSEILTKIAGELGVEEKEIRSVKAFKDKDNAAAGFTFETGKKYKYYYKTEAMEEL
ncbi:NTP transferase domain-containing protein [Blautia sp. HCP3S3_H10_1]|uniref:NTP transferase domain-containing protein n=1 Tax=unclassified Blautia TaxID=2648079 RepID=UPI003F92883D